MISVNIWGFVAQLRCNKDLEADIESKKKNKGPIEEKGSVEQIEINYV